jgi:hypothetical protein
MFTRLTATLVISMLVTACYKEVVARPPAPPVAWESLQPPPPAPEVNPLQATESERAVAKRYLQALASPNLADLGPLLDEEAHFRFAGGKDVRGRDQVVAAHGEHLGEFGDRKIVMSRVLRTDKSQALEWTLSGVQKATGRPVAVRGVTLLWTRDDGTITDLHLYFGRAVLKTPLIGAGAPEEVEQRRTPEEVANAALVRTALRALEDNDEAAYLATLSRNVELSTLEGASIVRGIAARRAWFRTMRGSIRHLTVSIEHAWGIGPFVVVEYHLIGEPGRRLGPAYTREHELIKMSFVDVAEIRAGNGGAAPPPTSRRSSRRRRPKARAVVVARVWRYHASMQPASGQRMKRNP